MTTSLRFSQRKDNQFYQPTLAGPSGGDGNGYVRVLDQAASFGYTWTVTPSSILDARLGFTHIVGGKAAAVPGRSRACRISTESPACPRFRSLPAG